MTGYLVVAHQTARSAELVQHLLHLAARDELATFTLLIPATAPSHLLIWEDGDAGTIAQRKANEAQALFEREGLRIARTVVGDPSPLLAIEDELRAHPGEHAIVILCTLPPGISHWLGLDLPEEVRAINIPVEHVTAGGAYR